jgi:hypothetical protein
MGFSTFCVDKYLIHKSRQAAGSGYDELFVRAAWLRVYFQSMITEGQDCLCSKR